MGLNPNQFAFKGMAKYAHPLAKYVRKGFTFHEGEVRTRHAEPGFFQASHTYTLGATHPKAEGEQHDLPSWRFPGGEDVNLDHTVAELHWAGEHSESMNYPGEVEWVNRHSHEPRSSSGIVDAMHAFAMRGGKSTVPVHSIDRSDAGDEWSRKVGPAHLRPDSLNEYQQDHYVDFDTDEEEDAYWEHRTKHIVNWRPPAGTHPYERAGSPPQLAPHIEGQGQLPGISAENQWAEQTGEDRRKQLEDEYHAEHPVSHRSRPKNRPLFWSAHHVPPSFD